MDIEFIIYQVPLQTPAINIAVGSYHSIAICQNQVFVWGKSDDCNLGELQTQQLAQIFCKHKICISQAQGGSNHSFAWKDNEVFCWGSNSNYELGLEGAKQFQLTKSQIFEDAFQAGLKLKQITCGQSHSLAVFEQEFANQNQCCIFAWGDCKNYQLGLQTNSIIPQPIQIDFNERVQYLHSRSDFNILITHTGDCYSWGSNLFGRIGFPHTVKNQKIPTQIKSLVSIKEVALGKYHCVAVDVRGQGYSWGHGMHGQLAISKVVSEIGPTKIDFAQPILQVSCGQSHTLVLTQKGLFSCGSNAYNALGHSKVDHKKRCLTLMIAENIPICAQKIMKIKCGYRHNILLSTQGSIYCWGCNKFNQLGLPATNKNSLTNRSPISNMKSFDLQDYSEQKSMKQSRLMSKQQKMMDWKNRYKTFKEQQAIKQKQFMLELQKIISDSCN